MFVLGQFILRLNEKYDRENSRSPITTQTRWRIRVLLCGRTSMAHALILQWHRVLGWFENQYYSPRIRGVHSSCSHSCVTSNCNTRITGILTKCHSPSSLRNPLGSSEPIAAVSTLPTETRPITMPPDWVSTALEENARIRNDGAGDRDLLFLTASKHKPTFADHGVVSHW